MYKLLKQPKTNKMRATRNTGNGIGRAISRPALEAKKARRNAAKKLRKQRKQNNNNNNNNG